MRTCKMCGNDMEENFECISYEYGTYFHSHCVGDRMIKDWLEKNGWIEKESSDELPTLPHWQPTTPDNRNILKESKSAV